MSDVVLHFLRLLYIFMIYFYVHFLRLLDTKTKWQSSIKWHETFCFNWQQRAKETTY